MIGFSTSGGVLASSVTATTALGLSAVWRCLDILSNGVSQLEWREVRGNLDLPPSRLVRRPQEQYTRREWVSIIVSTLALYDVCYLLKVDQDAEGVPVSLVYIQPSIVTPLFLDSFSLLPPREFMIRGQKVSRDDLVILHRSPQPGIYDGQGGIIQLARITFAAALASEGYASRYWQAGGSPTVVLESDSAVPDTIAKQTADRWTESRRLGPDHPAVLGSGLKAKDFGADPTQLAAVEARKEQVADIGRYFGIPTRISDQLPGGRRMVMDTRRLTTGTQLAQAQAYQLATANKAWMTPDEVREWTGLPPVESPDELNPPPPTPVIAAAGGPDGQGQED
jgi:phage portal protein BeeE